VEPAAAEPYFFANPTRAGYPASAAFLRPKPKDTIRIFLVGESAAKGFPQPRNLAFSNFLQAMLADLLPGTRIEVINMGTVAVASLPLVYQVRDALAFSPDLFVFYVGNNEFFGTYGTASISAIGTLPPRYQIWLRHLRGLAIFEAVSSWLYRDKDEQNSLMETMVSQAFIPYDSPLRESAARNLAAHLGTMLVDVQSANVPAVVCTTASNEAGLAPLGQADTQGLTQKEKDWVDTLIRDASSAVDSKSVGRVSAMWRRAAQVAPRHAGIRFRLGQSLAQEGNRQEARLAFLEARDLDTMPWRPTSSTEAAIRSVAKAHAASLCDLANIFRDRSQDGATGWELLDDHVHLSLKGQALAARSIAECIAPILGVAPTAIAALPADTHYEEILGRNIFDDYSVAYQMKLLFSVPFMKKSNPEAFQRFEGEVTKAEAKMSPGVLAAVQEWKTVRPESGDLRPLTGLVGRALQEEGHQTEALDLYRLAAKQVSDYTSWHLEYIYRYLLCRKKTHGKLGPQDQEEAFRAIAEGFFLIDEGKRSRRENMGLGNVIILVSGLYQLCGKTDELMTFLRSLRPTLRGEDRVAADQAMIIACLEIGNSQEALAIAEEGLKNGGRFAEKYLQLRMAVMHAGMSNSK
jgi:tetratricopeptide (TPR) repeat protein